MITSVAIVDHGCNLPPSDLAAIAAALTIQHARDFAPRWDVGDIVVRAATAAAPARDDEMQIGLYLAATQPDELGHHEVTDAGLPRGFVFPPLDLIDGVPYSATIGHELLEMRPDPFCTRTEQLADGRFVALEVCDAVENDWYQISGITVPNFVTPAYFTPPKKIDGVALDMMGLVKAPLELRPGGYNQFYTGKDGWQMQTSMIGIRSARVMSALVGRSRSARRRMGVRT